MCVIIHRQPNVTINPEKIESACKVNPDGYGISIIDRGKMETIKKYNSNGNDSAEVIRLLDEAKGFPMFVHLRYTTKGSKDEDNCHPFEVFSDGNYKVMLMHNGTLSSMGDANRSDTREFAEDYLRPLVRAFYEVEGEGILVDKHFEKIIEHFRSGGSVFTLYDSNGESLKLGKGYDHEGWWSSNEYSFNRYHRDPTPPFRGGTTSGHNSGYTHTGTQFAPIFNASKDEYGWYERGIWITHIERTASHRANRKKIESYLSEKEEPSNVVPLKKEEEKAGETKNMKTEKDQEEDFLEMECSAIGQAINVAKNNGASPAEHIPPAKRLTFAELSDISNLADINILNEEEILEIVERMPFAATLLIMDLLYALYKKDTTERVRRAQENNGTAPVEDKVKANG